MLEKHLASKPSLESEVCSLDSVESHPQASYSPPMVKETGSTVTIVVCTRNRPEALRCCLEAIARLTPPADEVLVVDNSEGDAETERVAREFANSRKGPWRMSGGLLSLSDLYRGYRESWRTAGRRTARPVV